MLTNSVAYCFASPYSDVTPELDFTFNMLPSLIRIESRNLASTTSTSGGAGNTIEPSSGLLENNAHAFVYNEGTVRTIGSVASTPVSDSTDDIAADPETLVFNGTTTLEATFLERTPLFDRIGFSLTHLTGPTRTTPIASIGRVLSVTDNGGFDAAAELVLPSAAFETWADNRGFPVPFDIGSTHPATGKPLALLYAFDVAVGDRLPELEIHLATGEVCLQLPEGGLIAGIEIESSSGLAGESWSTWEPDPGVPTVFPVGTSGLLRIPFDPGGQRFFRIRAEGLK